MSTLRQHLKWFFWLLAIAGTLLLVWALLDLWRAIIERHEIRQRSQIATLANATRTVMVSQELVLDLLGRELLLGDLTPDSGSAIRLVDHVLELNPAVVGYGLADADGKLVVVNSRFEKDTFPNLREQASTRTSFESSLRSKRMVIGQPYRAPALDEWIIPVRKAIRNPAGEVLGVMIAGFRLGGTDSIFDHESFLGPRNTVQVVRGEDLYPLHWAAAIDRPEGYYTRPIPREYYMRAVASAEKRSGMSIDNLKAAGRPVSYRVTNALGPHFGYTVYDPVYDYWVLTQTHRDQLLVQFLREGVIYVIVFVLLLLMILYVLRVIGRAEQIRQQELIYRADHDALTGLPNRQRMATDFERMSARQGNELSLLFIDMDNFKAFNDGFGHTLGDEFLATLGGRLMHEVANDECVARIGGDQFVLLVPETDKDMLGKRAQRLIDVLAAPDTIGRIRCELGCSIGIASRYDSGETLSDLLRAADLAMHAAKHQHNSVRFYDPEMGRDYLKNIRIEQRLRAAVDCGAIELYYQPQYFIDAQLFGIEALARWHDPELGDIAPERFIPIAEASGLIDRLGDYIAERAFSDCKGLQERLSQPLRLSLNVSVRQFRIPEFTSRLIDRVAAAGLEPTRLVLEITESLFMEDLERIMVELEQLRAVGIRISLDDFGTGFSSLSLLRSLPVDELKIDKTFVEPLEHDEQSRKLVQSIIAIGKNHGMTLLAEGVQSEQQLALLREDGCDAFQGFLFAKPMPIDELIEFISSRNYD